MKIINIDKNHRIIHKNGFYVPQYRPYFFRTILTRWLGGWSGWTKIRKLTDEVGVKHTISGPVKYYTLHECKFFLRNNKI